MSTKENISRPKNSAAHTNGNVRVARVIAENIQKLIDREDCEERKKTWFQNAIDDLIQKFGSATFLGVHIVWFAVWIVLNTGLFGLKPFDPYPFGFLTFVVSLEAIALSIMVLMAQNDIQEDADRRAELDLQVNLLAERETTMILRKLVRVEQALNIKIDRSEQEEVEEMIENTENVDLEMAYEKVT